MPSTCSAVFLQFLWQRNVLEWSWKAAVPWGRDRLPLVLACATSLLPAGSLAAHSLTSKFKLFCFVFKALSLQSGLHPGWDHLRRMRTVILPLTVMWLYIFSVTKQLACYLLLFPNHPISPMNLTMMFSRTFLFSCLPLCVSCCMFFMVQ